MNKQELIKFEKRIAKRFDDGEIPYLTHFSGGNEDQLIEIFKDIKSGDYVFSTHRSHYHYLLHGGDPERLEKLILDGRSMFVFDRHLNFYASSIVCSTPAIAAGVAWALKRNGSDKKVWCFIGDGAEDEGHFCEAARYVDGWNLPCTFIVEDNDRSVAATKAERWGNEDFWYWDLSCVEKYEYTPTYPHGGTNTPGWIDFQTKPVKEEMAAFATLKLNTPTEKEGYKDAVVESMNLLSDAGCIFVGYNVRHGGMYGTLPDVPLTQRLETPLAENLMAGLAIGMTLEGFRPVLYFERHDFIFNALDALVHQVDMIETISGGQFTAPIIIKAVVGGMYPFYAGVTHTSDYSQMCRDLFHFPVFTPSTAEEVVNVYEYALDANGPVMVSERKELY